jgi:hypothetical protein
VITWTQTAVRTVDGREVQTSNVVSLGFWEWTAAWVAATGSIGSFAVNFVNLMRALYGSH